ncbi:unnamed protein product [Caenorhabditis auriculariae]|uniref:Uncharacterized protein n=1 Tax=Caenorhabditis auriculariae TaxID=2777116 RepID=A0A8S1HLR3_9PELO|nr:unnamed protein product [Caenorhabditis auriculariae]
MPYNDSSVTTAKQKIVRGDVNDMGQSRAPKELGTFVEDHLWEYAIKERIDMEEVVEFLRKMYRSHEKDERSAKKNKSGNKSTATEETEPTKEGPSPGPRRKRSQMQVLDELVPEEDPLLEL